MPTPRKVLLLLILLTALGNLFSTLHRSAIPLGLEGTVSRVELRHEKHPRVDDVHLVWLGGRAVHLDPAIAEQLRAGDRISKKPGQAHLPTPRGPLRLPLSRDFKGMAVLMPLMVLIAAGLVVGQTARHGRKS